MFSFFKKSKAFFNHEVSLESLQGDMDDFYLTCPNEEKYIPKLCPLLQSLWDKFVSNGCQYLIEKKCDGVGIKRIEINQELPKFYTDNEREQIFIVVASMERKINNLISKAQFDLTKKYRIIFYGVNEIKNNALGYNYFSMIFRTPRLGFPLRLIVINKLTGTEYSFSCQYELKEL